MGFKLTNLHNCNKDIHELIEIYKHFNSDGDEVVRWCRICGAVMIDKEHDGKVCKDKILRIMRPRIINYVIT